MLTLQESFETLVPAWTYASDEYGSGVHRRPKNHALHCRYIRPNHDASCRWLLFDVDRPGGYFAADDANLPQPNFITVNPDSGHAHIAYLLGTPVATHDAARIKPLEYLAAVQRGIRNRLGADKGYCGALTQNPLHPHWSTKWWRDAPYSLAELNDWIFPRDKRFDPSLGQAGFGRNCTLFDTLRGFAYVEVRQFWGRPNGAEAFREHLFRMAAKLNAGFQRPLRISDLRAIAKSTAKWVWRRFCPEKFAAIQRRRVLRRWAGHVAESELKPWEGLGVSRSTYYRKKAKAR